ncbi:MULTISPECIES: hypothetical protein [Allobacillus]|uniref:Uncharacterized protein n=1 Tax=Allobacillus halotolerans TaxID=570278 RepID=A0ABS6GPG4_9BACI|nr:MULTISPECIES: hypothetical protein [Allobacillus]MBU6080540.1 hypothetical protein [Allobacillus halotolerans]TSJ69387.1 hypothetical protein FPQ10_02770 [Allobacillus sp. SKP2-8]
MIFKEMYQIITEDYLAVFLLILISAISYLGVNRFVRFCLMRYGTRTLSFMFTTILLLFWVFSDFSFLSHQLTDTNERYQFLLNVLIALMLFGLLLIAAITVKSLSQMKKNKNNI